MGNALSNEEINKRLHDAAEQGNIRDLEKYLKKGGDLNRLIDNGNYQKPQRIKPEFQSEKGEPFDPFVSSVGADSSVDGRSSVATTVTVGRDLKMNALHRAASRKNNMKTLNYILRHISDVDEQDSHGDSALHYVSMFYNNDKSLATLLRFQPNINLQNDRGETPLFSAVMRGCDLKVIEWLLKSGANPDICNIDGDTPLHACAVRRGIDPLIPGILLRFGASPNLKNRMGQTPLHIAAEATNNAVLLLLKFNAKVRLRDNNGRRPSEVAASEDIRKVLLEEENDLIARTVRTSDVIDAGHSHPEQCSPAIGSSTAVRNWLNKQKSSYSTSDIDIGETPASESRNDSRILYSRRSKSVTSDRTTDRENSYIGKFAGGGGNGIIHLPGNKEIIVPPDAMPLGTSMEITIDSNDENSNIPDLSGCNIKFDISVNMPGSVAPEGREIAALTPVFTGMCLEGQTKWICMRDVITETTGDTCVKFLLQKEKAIPLTKRPPSIRITAPIPPFNEDCEASESDDGHSKIEEAYAVDGKSTNETFCSREFTVYKEVSETSDSCDASDVESFTDDDHPNGVKNHEAEHVDLLDARQENMRIQHPIDYELATITE